MNLLHQQMFKFVEPSHLARLNLNSFEVQVKAGSWNLSKAAKLDAITTTPDEG